MSEGEEVFRVGIGLKTIHRGQMRDGNFISACGAIKDPWLWVEPPRPDGSLCKRCFGTRTMEIVCLWCPKVIARQEVPEAALPTASLPSGTLRTHGICNDCAEVLNDAAERYEAMRARRILGLEQDDE